MLHMPTATLLPARTMAWRCQPTGTVQHLPSRPLASQHATTSQGRGLGNVVAHGGGDTAVRPWHSAPQMQRPHEAQRAAGSQEAHRSATQLLMYTRERPGQHCGERPSSQGRHSTARCCQPTGTPQHRLMQLPHDAYHATAGQQAQHRALRLLMPTRERPCQRCGERPSSQGLHSTAWCCQPADTAQHRLMQLPHDTHQCHCRSRGPAQGNGLKYTRERPGQHCGERPSSQGRHSTARR